jgi:hypothetical protein
MSHIDLDKYDPPVKPVGDTTHMLVRAAIGILPAGSGTVLEAFNLFVVDPFQKRQTNWLRDLTVALNKVIADLEAMKGDERHEAAFLSSVLQSYDIAIRTGDAAMHERLILLVLSTIKDQEPDEELLSLYLSTLSSLTSSHLTLLDLISTRQRYEKGADLAALEALFILEITGQPGITLHIPPHRLLKDLESLSLIYSPEGSPWSSNSTNYCTMAVTKFGEEFISYISSPSSS